MQQISSVNNQTIKQIAKLLRKKGREASQAYLIEGFHLVSEAYKAHLNYQYLLGTSEALAKAEEIGFALDKRAIQINQAICRHLTAAKTPQGIFMVLKISQPKSFSFNYGKWVLLDNLSDPGNVGTIIRTADAAGFNGVVLSPESVDLYNPKVQRSMQGSQFHIDLLVRDLPETIAELQNSNLPVYASMLDRNAKKLEEFEPVAGLGLVIGNEAHGVSPQIAQLCDEKLYIPIYGQAESLNAAVAAGIMIYHFA